MQGFGLQVDPTQAGTPAFRKALMAVLTDPRYARAGQGHVCQGPRPQEHAGAGGRRCACMLLAL